MLERVASHASLLSAVTLVCRRFRVAADGVWKARFDAQWQPTYWAAPPDDVRRWRQRSLLAPVLIALMHETYGRSVSRVLVRALVLVYRRRRNPDTGS